MQRRQFIKAAATASACLSLPTSRARAATNPDVVIELTAGVDQVQIRRGPATSALRFSGRVLEGRSDALRPSGTGLGPTLELRRGERVRIHFVNRLREPSIIHWHGLIVPDIADGHPRFAVPSGGRYTYEFTVVNPAGTYLYHPHPHGRTGVQVYGGLVGLLIVRDSDEMATGLPSGAQELPVVIQDRRLDADNQLVYPNGMMDAMSGALGDTIVVNGKADARFKVARRPHRLRILNASNARIYKLAWSDGRPLDVVATDNGLLSRSEGVQRRPYIMLGPTERVEIVEDFSKRAPGTEIALTSLSFASGSAMGGMMGGMMGNMMRSSQGEERLIARFAINHEQPPRETALTLPMTAADLPDPRHEITTQLGFRHMRGFLSGRQFEMTAVAPDERIPRDTSVAWTFEHETGMGMRMPHPMHIHSTRFRVIARERSAEAASDVAEGFVDNGYKDTVLVFPGERVQVLMSAPEPGLFLYHCHNLEHEDSGMMRNFRVVS